MTVFYPTVEQVGEEWYYWVDRWTGPKGPFDSAQAAQDALQAELQTYHGH
jgi:hypothetical protein